MLVRRVVDDEVGDDLDAVGLGGLDELRERAEVAKPGINAVEVGDVVAVVSLGRGEEGHQPDAGDAEAGKVVDAFGQTVKVADAVAIAIEEHLDVETVDDGVLPPQVDLRFSKHGRSSRTNSEAICLENQGRGSENRDDAAKSSLRGHTKFGEAGGWAK